MHRFQRPVAVLWTLAIAVGCALPGDTLPDSELLAQDKLLHLVAFAGFAVLWLEVYERRAGRILAWGLAFGLAIEVYQHLAPIGRRFDHLDLVADVAGLAVGLLAWWIWKGVQARPVPA